MTSRPLLLTLLILGLVAVVYGTATLTGRWLGTPPWWERALTDDEIRWMWMDPAGVTGSVEDFRRLHNPTGPNRGRAWISLGVVAVGLGLLAVGARPRRRRSAAAS